MADRERTERFQQIEERVNQRVREAVAGLHGELRERLRRAGDQILEQLEHELEGGGPELGGTFLSREELSPLAEDAAREAAEDARRQALSGLVEALSGVDRAGSQSEILSALVREAGRFAARTALFLARPQGLELWSADGWEASLEGTVVDYAEEGAWSRDALGRGVTSLDSGEGGRLCGAVDAPLPLGGVLVPMVLRDRLAAVLYADHGEGEALHREALQALTYTAALALETLPFRERSSTPTLATVAGPAAAEEDGEALGVWSAAAGTAAAHGAGAVTSGAPGGAAAEPEPDAEPLPESAAFGDPAELEAPEDQAAEPEVEEWEAAEPGDGSAVDGSTVDEARPVRAAEAGFRFDDEPAAAAPPPAPPSPPAAGEAELDVAANAFDGDVAFDADVDEPGFEDEPEDLYDADLDGGTREEDAAEDGFDLSSPTPVEEAGWTLDDEEAPDADGPAAQVGELQISEPEPPTDSELDADDLSDQAGSDLDGGLDGDLDGGLDEVDLEVEEEPADSGFSAGAEAEPDSDSDSDEEPSSEEPAGGTSPFGTTPSGAGSFGAAPEAGEATGDLAALGAADAAAAPVPPSAPPAPPAATAVEPPDAGASVGGSSQVAPPSDLQGPGRAFASSAPAGEGDVRHDEARRLARLLVSEIRLYNEEEVEEGRRNNDIYERLKEDIDRSRQMYEERVDPGIRDSTDYFYQELVRNLGGGDAGTLGL